MGHDQTTCLTRRTCFSVLGNHTRKVSKWNNMFLFMLLSVISKQLEKPVFLSLTITKYNFCKGCQRKTSIWSLETLVVQVLTLVRND